MIETCNARIREARIFVEDHGILTLFLDLEHTHGYQGFGGYGVKTNLGWWVGRIFEVVGVSDWSDLKGKTIRCRADNSKVHAIGNIITDAWFEPTKELKEKGDI